MNCRKFHRAQGFSLLEFSVVLSLLTVILGGSMFLLLRTADGTTIEMQHLTVLQTGERGIRRVTEELIAAAPSSVLPAVLDDSEMIIFRLVTGYNAGSAVLGAQNRLSFQLAPGETDNNIDDNGDGRIDEGSLLFEEPLGSTAVTIAENVIDVGFTAVTGGVTFTIQVAIADKKGNLIEKTYTQQVTFRNEGT